MHRAAQPRRPWWVGRLAVAAACAVILAACGGTTKESSGGASATTAAAGQANPNAPIKQGLKIAFLPKQVNNPYFTISDNGGKKAIGEFSGEYKEVGPSEASASSQVSYINTLAQQHQDAIVVSANDQTSFQQAQGLLQAYPKLKGIISPTTVGISAAARYLSK